MDKHKTVETRAYAVGDLYDAMDYPDGNIDAAKVRVQGVVTAAGKPRVLRAAGLSGNVYPITIQLMTAEEFRAEQELRWAAAPPQKPSKDWE